MFVSISIWINSWKKRERARFRDTFCFVLNIVNYQTVN